LFFQILLIITFVQDFGGDSRIRIVPSGAEATAIELEFNHVFFDDDGGDSGDVTLTDSDTELLEASLIFLPIHGGGFVEAEIDTFLSARHIDFDEHLFAAEIGDESRGIVLREGGGRGENHG
jgi:hypothetical protein